VLYTYAEKETQMRTDNCINLMLAVVSQPANEQGTSSATSLRHSWIYYIMNLSHNYLIKKMKYFWFIFMMCFASCTGRQLAKISFRGNCYEMLYDYGNATSAECLIIKKNDVVVTHYKNASDSIEKIVLGKKNYAILVYSYEKQIV
jgi:hypothetical protein